MRLILQVGEIGWKADDKFMNGVNEAVVKSGNQIQLKVFRKSLEDNTNNRTIFNAKLVIAMRLLSRFAGRKGEDSRHFAVT